MKKLYLIIIFLLFSCSVFSLDKKKIDEPFDFALGRDVPEIVANIGKPEILKTFNQNDNKYTYMFYENMRISLWYMYDDDPPLMSVFIFSPSITVFDGVRVGMNYGDVRKKLGEPTQDNESTKVYYGNSHYITFAIDRFNQILSITWTYFLG